MSAIVTMSVSAREKENERYHKVVKFKQTSMLASHAPLFALQLIKFGVSVLRDAGKTEIIL